MNTSKTHLVRYLVGASLLSSGVMTVAHANNPYAQPSNSVGRAAIWSAEEANDFLGSEGIPKNARVITAPSQPVLVPVQTSVVNNTATQTVPSQYNNTHAQPYPTTATQNVPSQYNNTGTIPSKYNNAGNNSSYGQTQYPNASAPNTSTQTYPNTQNYPNYPSYPTANTQTTPSNSYPTQNTGTLPSYQSNYNLSASAYKPEVNARAALVLDGLTGEILYSKNINTVRPIASITKVMTGMVTMDAGLDMSERITLVSSDFAGAGGKNSSSTLRVGDNMSRSDALLLALMKSENPAAMALARTYPGGRSAFVAAMNEKARSLGMNSTRFADPSGLDPRNTASARDLGIMVSAAAKYTTISAFSSTASHQFYLGHRVLNSNNTNGLVRNGGWHIQLSKTGYIREAGRCVVMQTNINSRPTIVVLLGASDSATRSNDATRLFNWVGSLPQSL